MKVHFTNIDGIGLNAPVMLNGLEVGKVEGIEIVESAAGTKMELSVWLKSSAKLREGTVAFVKNMGFLGEKYVNLSSSGVGQSYLGPGSIIQGKDPADIDGLLLDGQEIATQVRELTTNLNERLKVNKEHIDHIMSNVDSITTNIDERLRVNEARIDNTLANFESMSTSFDQFAYDLKMNPWKLMYRPKEKRQRSIELLQKEREKGVQ